ncbi:TetR family transcriptional regulator [Nonomuraea sp. NEAU-A123]|uniref:TetR family transcriptional regulator n=1 Tax=Nonomuraea sp. NEAU-A123 TaxID=2839649 RepID=UPI001BE465AA|nr:TetR family transcriptional regulator [Nonomuraea sp. NEAU-A123]MBT2232491.1 TetR family transcriptional regulator [Nonomuraea sp. NEAU-A123]
MTDDTRSGILRVALELFASLGYHATSVREIAERLNLTKTAVLYHFPSKKDILATLAEPMLADMEAAVEAANGIEGSDFRRKRWVVIEGLLDVWLRHRFLMRMNTQDLALGADRPTFERFRDTAMTAERFIAGPDADLAGQVRAVQAFAMLSDPVVMFADLPADLIRPAVLAGVERLLGETVPGRVTGSATDLHVGSPSDLQAGSAAELQVGPPAGGQEGRSVEVSLTSSAESFAGASTESSAGRSSAPARPPGRRRGRPGAMSPDMIETARRMHATGEHTAADISRALGVSRATVYRHLSND